jgi:hypothetical protein
VWGKNRVIDTTTLKFNKQNYLLSVTGWYGTKDYFYKNDNLQTVISAC